VGSNAAGVAPSPAEVSGEACPTKKAKNPRKPRAPKPPKAPMSDEEKDYLSLYWNVYRALYSPNATDERFWGPGEHAVRLRLAVLEMHRSGTTNIVNGLLGTYFDPKRYWVDNGMAPDQCGRLHNIEKGHQTWLRLTPGQRQAVIDHVKKWEVWDENRRTRAASDNGTNSSGTPGNTATRPAPDNADGGLDSGEVRSGAGGDTAAAV
jgi:hypothetical protein